MPTITEGVDMSTTLTADLFISADGWARGAESPGYFGYLGPDLQRWIDEEGERQQHVLMGRKTYEALAGLPVEFQDEGYERMASLTTTVFSRTLEKADWANTTVESGDLVETVRGLKDSSDVPLRTMGSISVVKQLINTGLIDNLRLMVFPLFCGPTGREWAFDALNESELTLNSQRVLDDRILLIDYTPTGRPIPR